MSTNLGDPQLKHLFTSRLYWRPDGETGWVDFGNVISHKHEPEVQRVNHLQARKGFRAVDLSMVKSVKLRKTLDLDEHFELAVALRLLGRRLAVGAGGLRFIVSSGDLAAGQTYDMDTVGMVNPVPAKYVKFSDAPGDFEIVAMDPAEYVIDPLAGTVKLNGPFTVVLADGAHLGEEWPVYQVEVVYTTPAIFYDSFSRLLQLGTFKLMEFDQFSQVPAAVEDFTGQVYVTGWGENNLEGFNKFSLEVLHAPGTRKSRQ